MRLVERFGRVRDDCESLNLGGVWRPLIGRAPGFHRPLRCFGTGAKTLDPRLRLLLQLLRETSLTSSSSLLISSSPVVFPPVASPLFICRCWCISLHLLSRCRPRPAFVATTCSRVVDTMARNSSAKPRRAPKPKFHERDIVEIANQEDSSDDDFDIGDYRASSKSRKQPSKSKRSKKSKRTHRKRRHGSYSSDEVVDDSESGSDDSSNGSDQTDDSNVEINPKTGRAVRTTSKKAANYAESSVSDSSSSSGDSIASDDDHEIRRAVKQEESDSLVVTLHAPSEFLRTLEDINMSRPHKRETRSRTGSVVPLASGLRRSARISQSPEPSLVALGAKGRIQKMAKDGALLSVLSEKSFEVDAAHTGASSVNEEGESQINVADENVATPSNVDGDHAEEPPVADADIGAPDELQGDPGSPMESIEVHHKAFFDDDVADDESDEELPVKRVRSGKHRKHKEKRKQSSEDKDGEYQPFVEERPAKKSKSHRGKSSSDFEEDSFEDEDAAEEEAFEVEDEIHELIEGKKRVVKKAREPSPLGPRKRLEPGAYGAFAAQAAVDEERADLQIDEERALAAAAKKPRKGAPGFIRPKTVHSAALFSMGGIFGGASKGNISESDSSDEEGNKTAALIRMDGPPPTPHGANTAKSKNGGADITPLKVTGCDFSNVGGHENTLSSLNETMILPILYQQEFKEVDMKPPAGVLFTGPPGTGKTLLARAVAGELEKRGIKATFYMRKGGDVMSKYVGEAERSLRMLFETARKTAPSIIFFDEFDGKSLVVDACLSNRSRSCTRAKFEERSSTRIDRRYITGSHGRCRVSWSNHDHWSNQSTGPD
jgi:hypothetical protein